MTLQYNILNRQSKAPAWAFAGAVAGSLALHGLVVALALALVAPHGGTVDEAAITIFVDPAAPPVATAMERAPLPAAEPEPTPEPEVAAALPPPEPAPEPTSEPEVAAAPAPPPEPALQDAVPAPPLQELLAPPDFTQPPPPPPPPPPQAEPRKPPPPQPQKAEPRRAAPPAPARAAPAGPPTNQAAAPTAPAPQAAPPAAAPGVAPGWNALLAAWLAANRRYPDEARRRSEEGEVTVRFTVAGDGRVGEVALVKGSGSAALDAAALRLLQGATLPAPGTEATRTVRIRFRLSD